MNQQEQARLSEWCEQEFAHRRTVLWLAGFFWGLVLGFLLLYWHTPLPDLLSFPLVTGLASFLVMWVSYLADRRRLCRLAEREWRRLCAQKEE